MAEFRILDHLDKLESDGGTNDPRGDHSYLCPACGSSNFKVNIKTGKWGSFGCDCSSTDAGKRKIRDALSPAVAPGGSNATSKQARPQQRRSWNYFTPVTLARNTPALTVHRTDDGRGKRKIWQESLIPGHGAAEVKDKVLPYGLPEAQQGLADGAPYVFWVEGEPCVDAFRALGLFAITSIGGAGKFNPDRDAGHVPADRLVVVPDRDKPGVAHMEDVAAEHPGCQWLYAFPGTAEWNGAMPKDGGLDVVDWINAGATVEHILHGIGQKLKPAPEPSPSTYSDEFSPDDDDERELIAEQLQLNERLAQGRSLFTLDQLLPANLARSVALLNRSLPTDDLSATMLLLAGYSGLLKLGTRVSSSVGFSVPANLFVAGVMPSGGSKTQAKKRLIDAPAKEIRKQAARDHTRQMKDWEQTPKNDRPPAPQPVFPHLSDYTPAALSKQLQLNEERGLGQLIINDELSGLFGALLADAQRGTGRAESQILEAFDGEGFSSVRIESAPRNYESCHVSIYGNIQPDLLKDLINHQDVTGKFARFLFVRIPRGPLQLLDDDPTDEQIQAFEAAEQVLAQYAQSLYSLAPRTYRFEQEARKRFHAWFHEHQIRAGLRGCPSVISALLGKTSAHALRIAGILHLLRIAAGELEPSDRISSATVDQAMAIVDQLTQETEAFHEQESSERALLLTHVHQLSWDTSKPITRDQARNSGGKHVRSELKAEAWPGIIQQLVNLGFGVIEEKRSANGRRSQLYRAIKPMA